jgi:hypothetical protein
MNGIKHIQSEDEFQSLLQARRAIVFFWVPWAIQARRSQAIVETWVREKCLPVEVNRVDPDDQPFVVGWLDQQGKDYLGYTGYGALAWLEAGHVVAELVSPMHGGEQELQRLTRVAWPLPVIEPSVLAWNGGCVGRLAKGIKAEGTFDDLPILADALEEAGYTNAELLDHCRRPEHPGTRNCWVIDAVLAGE